MHMCKLGQERKRRDGRKRIIQSGGRNPSADIQRGRTGGGETYELRWKVTDKYGKTAKRWKTAFTKSASYTTNAGGVQILASGKPASVLYGVKSQITSLKNSRKGQVAVKFNKVSGVKTYYVYRATKKNGSYTLLGSTKTTTYTDKKASKGKTYYYKVVGKGTNALKANFSLESAVKSVKVKK